MREYLRYFVGVALTLLSGLEGACVPCDDQGKAEVVFAALDVNVDQTVNVTFRHNEAEAPSITCLWSSPEAGQTHRWTCTPKADSADTENPGALQPTVLYFPIADPKSTWLIELAGPSSTQTLMRTPARHEVGAESCGVNFEVDLTGDDLRAVGATPG